MDTAHEQRSETTMITFDCPWCAEAAMVETTDAGELACEACGAHADLAADPVEERIAQAA